MLIVKYVFRFSIYVWSLGFLPMPRAALAVPAREGGREGGREGWRDGGREGWREGGREGGRDGGRKGGRSQCR
jgi:hypothetical protein